MSNRSHSSALIPHSSVVALANQKGGVGKTTTAVSLGAELSASGGLRILLIDLDPQANATSSLGLDPRAQRCSTYDALLGNATLEEVVVPSGLPGLDIAPANYALAGAQVELVEVPRREYCLARALASLAGMRPRHPYDLVLVETLELVRASLNPRLVLIGILLTMLDARTNLSGQVAREVQRHFPAATFKSVIPRSVRLSEAPSYGRPIRTYDPSSRGAQAYALLAQELVERVSVLRTEG